MTPETTSDGTGPERSGGLAAVLVGFAVLYLGLGSLGQVVTLPFDLNHFSAFFVKHHAAERIAAGQLLYRDHIRYGGTVYHYPPVFLYTLGAVYGLVGPSRLIGRAVLSLSSVLCAAVMVPLVGAVRDRATARVASLAFVANPVMVVGAYVGYFDPFVTLFVLLSILALLRGYSTASGVSLGVGIMSKLFPALMLPLVSLYCLRTEDARLPYVLAGVASVVAAASVPFLVLAPDAYVTYAFLFNFERPTASLSLYYYFLPWLESTLATVALPGGFVVAVTYVTYRAELPASAVLTEVPAVLFLGFLLLNRINYPHYLVYVVPFVSIIAAETYRSGTTVAGHSLWRVLLGCFGAVLFGAAVWAYPWLQGIETLEGAYYEFKASPYFWLGSGIYFLAGFLLIGVCWRAIARPREVADDDSFR